MRYLICSALAITVLAYASALCAADSDYSAATGYVTMSGNDSTSASTTQSSFNSKGKWSDGKDPHSGTNYYVNSTRTLTVPNANATFAGNKIVVAGTVFQVATGGKNIKWSDAEFLPGSKFRIQQVAPIRCNGCFTISGTEEAPFKMYSTRSTASEILLYPKFCSGSQGYMVLANEQNPCTSTHVYTLKTGSNWSEYEGTLSIGPNCSLRTENASLISMPGTIKVRSGGRYELFWKNVRPEVGTLVVESGGELCPTQALNSSYHITKKLELEPGSYVVCSNKFNIRPTTEPTCMVFRLSADAVAAGIPNLGQVKFCAPNTSTLGRLPRFLPVEKDDSEVPGGKYIGWRKQEVVSMTNLNQGTTVALKPPAGMTSANFWSDGLEPHDGVDYLVEKNFWITGKSYPYTFPGESWTVRNITLGLYSNMRDFTVPDLSFVGGTLMCPFQNAQFRIRGKLSLFSADNGMPATVRVANAPEQSVTIHSEIDGDNDLMFLLLSSDIESLSGAAALAGLNTNYCGRVIVATTNDVYTLDDGSEKSVDRNNTITLNISDARNLGGKLEEFCYDSLTLSNHCRLAINGDTVFSETSRGWYFPENAYLRVASGKSAACKNVFTVGGTLVKEGSGTLSIGAPVSVEGESARISVEDGCLAVSTSDALVGVPVTISADASLAIDAENGDENFGQFGLNLTGTSIAAANGGKIDVQILPGEVENWEGTEIPVFTYAAAESQNVACKFRVLKPSASKGIAIKRVERDNGDGTRTLVACFAHVGTVFSLR